MNEAKKYAVPADVLPRRHKVFTGLLFIAILMVAPASAQVGNRSIEKNTIPLSRLQGASLETDWLIGIRIPHTGTSEGLIVRYRVTADRIVLQSLDNHPTFNFTSFPGHPRQLVGDATPDAVKFSNLRQQTVERKDLRDGRRPGVFDLGRLTYDSRQCGWAALEARSTQQQLRQLLTSTARANKAGENAADHTAKWFRNARCQVEQGRVTELSWQPQFANTRQVNTFEYRGDELASMQTHIPEKTLPIPLSEKNRHSIEVRYNQHLWEKPHPVDLPHVPVRLKSAPLKFHDGGRDITVRYQNLSLGDQPVTLPVDIEVRSHSERHDLVRLLRFAKLISARVVDEPPQDFELLKKEVLDGPVNKAVLYHGKHFRDGNDSPAAQAAYQRVDKLLGPRPGQPFYHKLAYHAFYISRSVRAGKADATIAHADQWLNGITSSGFQPLFAECSHSLLMRIERSGTLQIYEAISERALDHAPALDVPTLLDGCLHTRNNVYCPWFLFRLGCQDQSGRFFSVRGLDPETALRRCYFAASLIGRLIDRMAEPPKAGQMGYFDEIIQNRMVTPQSLQELRTQILTTSRTVYSQLRPSQQDAFEHHFRIIEGWTNK